MADAQPVRMGGMLSMAGSAVALVASGVSLWETVLKQPQLKVYLGETLSYTRDPYGSFEVFAVPITVMNSGARDGAVMSMRMTLTNAAGDKDTYEGAYLADANWFAGRDDVSSRTKRPKAPFAPLSIAGRAAWSGTVLFYSSEYREKKLAEPKTKVSGTISFSSPVPGGWLDRGLYQPLPAIAVAFEVPNYLPGALLSGDVVRLRTLATDALGNAK